MLVSGVVATICAFPARHQLALFVSAPCVSALNTLAILGAASLGSLAEPWEQLPQTLKSLLCL